MYEEIPTMMKIWLILPLNGFGKKLKIIRTSLNILRLFGVRAMFLKVM